MAKAYTVTQMNLYIKNMFSHDFVLNRVSVKGEISNCKYHNSGHIYFTLKDELGTLAVVMFANSARNLKMRLENGMQVVVDGKIDVYERDGKYQLYAQKIEEEGLGDLYKRYEALKVRFEEMGYFSPEYKRPIPVYSKRIGIVTAQTGAAIQDICNIAHRRNPYVQLILYPALVQGDGAAVSIVKGIETLDKLNMDVIIVGRGGGSIEDLWAFNEEIVAEAIFNAKTPVISAVGHETDFTIADFVSDLRAPTPSAAAELSVADISLIENRIEIYASALRAAVENKLLAYHNRLDNIGLRLKLLSPSDRINEQRYTLARLEDRLRAAVKENLMQKRHHLELLASRLNGLSPLAKLTQGYAYVEDMNGDNISSIKSIKNNDEITVHFKDGSVKANIVEVYDGKDTDY